MRSKNDNLDLTALRALHAAANGHKLRVKYGTARIETDSSPSGYVGICVFASDAEWFAAIHNAFPALADRLEAAERERDEARQALSGTQRDVITLRGMVERNAAERDSLNARHQAMGAAKTWEIVAVQASIRGDANVAAYADKEAARMRREAGE